MLHVEIVLKTKQPEAKTSLVYDVFIRVIKRERELKEWRNKHVNIVIRGDWLWKAANINDKNNSAAVYVQRTVKVQNPLFSAGKLLRNKLMQRSYWSI